MATVYDRVLICLTGPIRYVLLQSIIGVTAWHWLQILSTLYRLAGVRSVVPLADADQAPRQVTPATTRLTRRTQRTQRTGPTTTTVFESISSKRRSV